VRLGVAWRGLTDGLCGAELRLAAIAVIHRATVDRTSTDVVLGGGATALWAVPLPLGDGHRGTSLLLGGGVDGFATRRAYRVDGTPVASTARIAWWAGVAISAELWR